MNVNLENKALIPGKILALVAIISAAALTLIALFGPLGWGMIQYRTSSSGLLQTQAQDTADLFLIAPLLLIGATLQLAGRNGAKYFLILPPITLIYTGLSLGIGQEWSNPAYVGNVENFFGLFLTLIIGGLILLIGSLSMFTQEDSPYFKPKGLRIYVGILALFLLLFAGMWISQILQVINTGNTVDGAYAASPTAFWIVHYFDLGVSIPVGFLSLFLFLSKPRQVYPLLLLFFGFFITMATAVNLMVLFMVINNDPAVAGSVAGLVIFPVLAILAYGGLVYLLKDKLRILRVPSRLG